MAKGSSYERELCNQFSLWWTDNKRDDIFWRAAGSGNRAKSRGRAGKGTHGQHGDICATDPDGAVLIDLFTIEIKRGYSAHTLYDLMDRATASGVQGWDQFLDQVLESHDHAGSFAWMLINRRDRKDAMVWFPAYVVDALRGVGAFTKKPCPFARITTRVRRSNNTFTRVDMVGMRLGQWFSGVTPGHLRALAKEA